MPPSGHNANRDLRVLRVSQALTQRARRLSVTSALNLFRPLSPRRKIFRLREEVAKWRFRETSPWVWLYAFSSFPLFCSIAN